MLLLIIIQLRVHFSHFSLFVHSFFSFKNLLRTYRRPGEQRPFLKHFCIKKNADKAHISACRFLLTDPSELTKEKLFLQVNRDAEADAHNSSIQTLMSSA